MSDVRNYSRTFIAEFIELYKSLPSLWKVKSREYLDRNKKRRDYQKMISKLKEVEPDATRDLVTKKINSLRSSYRKEKNKVEKSLMTDDVHTPTLWYYSNFDFLTDQEAPWQSSSDFLEGVSMSETDTEDKSNNFPVKRTSSQCSTGYSVQTDTEDSKNNFPLERPSSQGSAGYSLPYEEPSRRVSYNKRAREMDNTIYCAGKRSIETSEDYFETFGRNIAYKLRNLPREQRIFAEKIINDALFESELGNLNRHAYIHIPVQSNEINPTHSQ